MAKKLELNFSTSKDAEIVRFIQLNTDENTSPMMIAALEYYIKTGGFLKIGKVCITPSEPEKKVRKPIYVPVNSVVDGWAEEQKKARKGLLSSKVRYILKNSLEVVEKTEDEMTENYMELLIKVDKLGKKPLQKPPEEVPKEVIKEPPITQPYAPQEGYKTEKPIDFSEKEPDPSVKQKNRGLNLMSKMMPVGFDD